MFSWRNKKNTSQHITKPTVRFVLPSKTDQPAHPCSLIRAPADCMYLLHPPGYLKRDIWEPLYWVDVCWSRRSYCSLCHTLAHFKSFWLKKASSLELWSCCYCFSKMWPLLIRVYTVCHLSSFSQLSLSQLRLFGNTVISKWKSGPCFNMEI